MIISYQAGKAKPLKPTTITPVTAVVIHAFLTEPSKPRFGLELARTTGVPSGSVYSILARLESDGWLAKVATATNSRVANGPRQVLLHDNGKSC